MKHLSFALIGLLLLGGCKAEKAYFTEIQKNGFIPFTHPMTGVGTGLLVRGAPDNLSPMAPANRCVPEMIEGKPSNLRWDNDSSIANKHYQAKIEFGAELNTIATAGSPTFSFNLKADYVRTVDFKLVDAKIERIDQLAFQDYYLNGMSEACKKNVTSYPFVLDALKATEMRFTFYDASNGKIKIDVDNIEQIVDFAADVSWHIENGYDLVFTTPKYVGYHLAKLAVGDDGLVHIVSVKTKQNEFVWEDLNESDVEERYSSSLSLY